IVVLLAGDRREEPGEVLVARPASKQVGGDAGITSGRVLAGRDEVDVDVQDGHRLLAPHVARIGAQEPLQLVQFAHCRSKPGSSRYPLATNPRRILRRASKITL